MKQIINYAILTENSYSLLEVKVLNFIKNGWVPQGGISTSIFGISQSFYQAMVMYDD